MKKILFLLSIFIISQCASKPEIIRRILPVANDNLQINTNEVIQEIDHVKIKVRYMDKIELNRIAEENNPYLEGDMPLLTTFKIEMENRRNTKINFNIEDAVLLDGLGNQYNALTYESFKNLYPSTIYQKYEYSFIFDRYYTESQYTDDYYKRKKAAKTLFKGGKIFPEVKVQGIVPFEMVSERAKNLTLILTDIELNQDTKQDQAQDQDKVEKTIEFKFQFIQKIVRLKE